MINGNEHWADGNHYNRSTRITLQMFTDYAVVTLRFIIDSFCKKIQENMVSTVLIYGVFFYPIPMGPVGKIKHTVLNYI